MGDFTNALRKWLGYLATGATILLFFGITGWLALVFAGYAYLQLLWKENPVRPQQAQTQQAQNIMDSTNQIESTDEAGKLPPNQQIQPIMVYQPTRSHRRNRGIKWNM